MKQSHTPPGVCQAALELGSSILVAIEAGIYPAARHRQRSRQIGTKTTGTADDQGDTFGERSSGCGQPRRQFRRIGRWRTKAHVAAERARGHNSSFGCRHLHSRFEHAERPIETRRADAIDQARAVV